METEDYELATYTYFLARFVHTGLSSEPAVMQQFPLLKSQWGNVMGFEQVSSGQFPLPFRYL